jgi:hypothetical protein
MRKIILICIIFVFHCNIIKAQWVHTQVPYNTYPTCFAVTGPCIYTGTQFGGIYLSVNNGSNWTAINHGLTHTDVYSLAISGQNVFAGNVDGVFMSSDSGANWVSVSAGLNDSTVIALAANDSIILDGNAGGVFLSKNNGTTWTAINNGLTNLIVRELAIHDSNFYAGTAGGMFVSIDEGANWNSINNGLTNLDVISLAISGSNIYAGTFGGGVFLSTDNGLSWNAVNNGLTNLKIMGITVFGSIIFVGTFDGIFYSKDNGQNWTVNNTALPDFYTTALGNDGINIYAGILMEGVWMRLLSDILGINETINSTTISIYPNPATNYLNIDNTSKMKNESMEIYNISGQRLFTQRLQEEKTTIDLSGLAKGFYFIKTNTEDNIKTTKLIIQ